MSTRAGTPASGAPPPLIYSQPLTQLAADLRIEADALRARGTAEHAAWLADSARRLENAVASAAAPEWLSTSDLAALRGVTLDAVAAQCRRRWAAAGKARKAGGHWQVHASVLPSAARRAA